MKHVLVSSKNPALVDALREASESGTVFLSEEGLDETLDRIGRSARVDAVVTDDLEVLSAIRREIPGAIPVHLVSAGEAPATTWTRISALLD